MSIGKNGDVFVSTIFLGCTNDIDALGRPLLFESIVSRGKHNVYTRLYATWNDAMAGHQEIAHMVGIE